MRAERPGERPALFSSPAASNSSFLCPASHAPFPSNSKSPRTLKRCIALLRIWTSIPKLKQIHAFSIRNGVSITDPDMGKHLLFALVSLSSPMSYVFRIFSQIPQPNIFTYNTVIRGYAESETPQPALRIYHQMLVSCIKPDTHTYPFLLKAVSKVLDVTQGEMVHCHAVKDGFESLVFVQNTLVHMYAACGVAESAYKVFERMTIKDLVTWNSVINGFAVNGRPNEALTLLREMGLEGVEPDAFTIVSLLCACAELGAMALGKRTHVYIFKVGLDDKLHVGNALIDLYAKCGAIEEAHRVFREMELKSVVSWNSLIVGLAVNGFGKEALKLFDELKKEKMPPTEITFIGVLYACSHCGMVNEGFDYFERMENDYSIVPKIEHYGCMVDLLGRAGRVQEAHDFIRRMPLQPNAVVWRTLLGSCTMHGHVGLGEVVRARLAQLEPRHDGDYVLLSNLYASERRWTDAQKIRKTMLREGVKKSPGHSLVEIGNCMHEFIRGDKTHPRSEEIYGKLEEIWRMLKLEGYVPRTTNVLADIEEEEKENALCYHSEKLAIAFALISSPSRAPIRVIKNLRVCADCHVATKLISKVYNREIIVRDRSRFHHFKDGYCSCRDYW